MSMQIEGMMSPQQAALRQAEGQLQIESLLETITAESQKLADAAQGPNIMPGTGGKTPGMLMQEQQAKLEAQNTVQKIAAATDWENLAVTLGQDIAALAHQQRAVTDKIVKDSSVSFFDDPLTALANAFTLPWDEQALEGITTKLETTTKMANAAHSHVQQSAVTADRIKTEVTQATLAEQATALENYQASVAAQARLDAAKTGAYAIKESLAMDRDALSIYVQEVQLRNSAEQMAMARNREARQMELMNIQLNELKDKEAAEGERLRFINNALVADGKNPIDIKRFNLYKQTSAEMLDALTRKGMEIEINGKDKYNYGAKIEDRFQYLTLIGATPKTEQQRTVWMMQNDAFGKVPPNITDKNQRSAEANKIFNKEFVDAQKNIGEGSPFAAPAYEIYAGTKTAMHPVWQKYVAPTLTAESAKNPVTPEFIREAISKAVLDKTVTSSEAAAFAKQVFDQALATNNKTHHFNKIAGAEQQFFGVRMKMGISPLEIAQENLFLPSATKVGTSVLKGLFGNAKRFEATDKTQWEALIARDVATMMIKNKIIVPSGTPLGVKK